MKNIDSFRGNWVSDVVIPFLEKEEMLWKTPIDFTKITYYYLRDLSISGGGGWGHKEHEFSPWA